MDAAKDPIQLVQKALREAGDKPYLKIKLTERLTQLRLSEQSDQQTNDAFHLQEDHEQSGQIIQSDFAAEQRRSDAAPAMPKERSEMTGSSSSNQLPQVKKLISL
eukprot:gnl/MRDRNA2_/MRDRNA2_81900_c0_seq1.p1 gnl/MRDRNA2_/MRDRNA2_81900_c0~~gnl/MRDRNA2_/MRDRNA2_81900_c0_seq1.p1  ORF type:complete len:105 (+),score=30.70 gnl/MRDRNA2_/MRDRNA2_81900_c0_seq1:2-316(+)